jgi:hypothetical protein
MQTVIPGAIGSILYAKIRIELGNGMRYKKDEEVIVTPYNQTWILENLDLFYMK